MRRARATLLDRYYTGASNVAMRFVYPAGNEAAWRAERRCLRILPGSSTSCPQSKRAGAASRSRACKYSIKYNRFTTEFLHPQLTAN